MKNIVLIGLPASGKTTVGKALAKRTGRPFSDSDERIVRREGKSVAELFAEKGEPYFRDAESAVIRALAQTEGQVIATGGGVILREENMRVLKENGLVLFLDRPVQEILKVMGNRPRPLLQGGEEALTRLQKQRDKLYRKYADYTLTGGSVAELAETAALLWEMTGGD